MSKKYGRRDDDHLTVSAMRRLARDLHDLEKVQRPKAVEDLIRAREMGDLSENAAYSEAKGRLARIDGRIFSLKDRLKNAVVIEPGADASGRVRIGSTVVVSAGGARRTYEIVGSQETSPSRGRISHLSPLGSVLLGRVAGDEVIVKTQKKNVVYRIEEVR